MRWTIVFLCVLLSILSFRPTQAQVEESDVRIPEEGDEQVKAEEATGQTGASTAAPTVTTAETLFTMPIVLPPANISAALDIKAIKSYCLLYMEGINIFLWKKGDTPTFRHAVIGSSGYDSSNITDQFGYADGYANCDDMSNGTVGVANFTISITPANDIHNSQEEEKADLFKITKTNIRFELVFTGETSGYWGLTSIRMITPLVIEPVSGSQYLDRILTIPAETVLADKANFEIMNIRSFTQYGYACSQTPGTFFSIGTEGTGVQAWGIGIGFINFEVDLKAYTDVEKTKLTFNRDVYDCVGTFSVGSWMGIVCSLVLASILMFGYLMLQSVQTMDRFDDPKQKQIVINYKD